MEMGPVKRLRIETSNLINNSISFPVLNAPIEDIEFKINFYTGSGTRGTLRMEFRQGNITCQTNNDAFVAPQTDKKYKIETDKLGDCKTTFFQPGVLNNSPLQFRFLSDSDHDDALIKNVAINIGGKWKQLGDDYTSLGLTINSGSKFWTTLYKADAPISLTGNTATQSSTRAAGGKAEFAIDGYTGEHKGQPKEYVCSMHAYKRNPEQLVAGGSRG